MPKVKSASLGRIPAASFRCVPPQVTAGSVRYSLEPSNECCELHAHNEPSFHVVFDACHQRGQQRHMLGLGLVVGYVPDDAGLQEECFAVCASCKRLFTCLAERHNTVSKCCGMTLVWREITSDNVHSLPNSSVSTCKWHQFERVAVYSPSTKFWQQLTDRSELYALEASNGHCRVQTRQSFKYSFGERNVFSHDGTSRWVQLPGLTEQDGVWTFRGCYALATEAQFDAVMLGTTTPIASLGPDCEDKATIMARALALTSYDAFNALQLWKLSQQFERLSGQEAMCEELIADSAAPLLQACVEMYQTMQIEEDAFGGAWDILKEVYAQLCDEQGLSQDQRGTPDAAERVSADVVGDGDEHKSSTTLETTTFML